MPEKLIHLPIEEARAERMRRTRAKFGHPLEELDKELLDAMNYAEEAEELWDLPMAGIREGLRDLCERIRAIYGAVEGNTR